MVREILSFAVLVGILTIGWSIGLYYLVGGDFDYQTENVTTDDDVDIDLSSFNGCFYYMGFFLKFCDFLYFNF